MTPLSRRQFLVFGAAAALSATYAPTLAGRGSPATPTVLRVERRTLDVLGRPASVVGILRPDGRQGLTVDPGARFNVVLENHLDNPTLVHWHGQTPPTDQDGVPGLSQEPLVAGGAYSYDYDPRPGAHWMHSHVGFQRQKIMAAPLIVRTPDDLRDDAQEIVVLLHDFTFRDPEEIFAELRRGAGGHGAMKGEVAMSVGTGHGAKMDGSKHAAMRMPKHTHATAGSSHGGSMQVHLNDVEFDAYLANDRALDDPDVRRVEPGSRVRLRMINGAGSTNFIIDLGALEGKVTAVDGNPVTPVPGHRFPIAMAQRLDITVRLPTRQGAWPILALREGDTARTGIVLATARGQVKKMTADGDKDAEIAGLDLEKRLSPVKPLPPRPVQRTHRLVSTEGTSPYVWALNGKVWGKHQPLEVTKGQRVEIVFENPTNMSHPMHLHGHHFQVVSINGHRFSGAVRDTVLVPAKGSVTIAFDANNPGRWALHCHNLYHMVAGMMTEIQYAG